VAGGSFEFVHDQMHAYLAARWFHRRASLGVRPRTSDFSALCQNAIDRQWSRAPQDEGRKAGQVKEIGFKARRPNCAPAAVTAWSLIELNP